MPDVWDSDVRSARSGTLKKALARAKERARQDGSDAVLPEHLLWAIMSDTKVQQAFVRLGRSSSNARRDIAHHLPSPSKSKTKSRRVRDLDVSIRTNEIINAAADLRREMRGKAVEPIHVLAAFADYRKSPLAKFLNNSRMNAEKIAGLFPKPKQKKKVPVAAHTGDGEVIRRAIEASGRHAPAFVPHRGRLQYRQRIGTGQFSARKKTAEERCVALQQLAARRSNEQPELIRLVTRYAQKLDRLRKGSGIYELFIAGIEIEIFLNSKQKAPVDPDRNPALDADLSFGVQSLILAHAGLIALFPDTSQLANELDSYRQQSEAIDALRDRILDPILSTLARAENVFDQGTLEITKAVSDLDQDRRQPPIKGAVAAKHGWLRGAVSAIGQFVLEQLKAIGGVARDTATGEIVSLWAKSPDTLLAAIVVLLASAKEQLLSLSLNLEGTFGWLRSLLGLLGLH